MDWSAAKTGLAARKAFARSSWSAERFVFVQAFEVKPKGFKTWFVSNGVFPQEQWLDMVCAKPLASFYVLATGPSSGEGWIPSEEDKAAADWQQVDVVF